MLMVATKMILSHKSSYLTEHEVAPNKIIKLLKDIYTLTLEHIKMDNNEFKNDLPCKNYW